MGKANKPTRRAETLTERAYDLIKHGILRGEIEEGTFLSEGEVRRKYGVGRTPFREACNRLHHEQLLEVVPRRGYLVSEISFRSVREIFEVRVVLEGLIAEFAALRADPREVDELERLAKRTWSLGNSRNNYEALVKANTRFHLCLAGMAHNRELLRLITGILERTERLSYLQLRSSGVQSAQMQVLHKPILDAIRKRNPTALREAVVNDIVHGQVHIFGARDGASDHKWLHAAFRDAPGDAPA